MMDTVPEGLTPELLSDVLGRKVACVSLSLQKENQVTFWKSDASKEEYLNLNTLTRLMEDYLIKKCGYCLEMHLAPTSIQIQIFKHLDTDFYAQGETKIEALIECVQWVRDNK